MYWSILFRRWFIQSVHWGRLVRVIHRRVETSNIWSEISTGISVQSTFGILSSVSLKWLYNHVSCMRKLIHHMVVHSIFGEFTWINYRCGSENYSTSTTGAVTWISRDRITRRVDEIPGHVTSWWNATRCAALCFFDALAKARLTWSYHVVTWTRSLITWRIALGSLSLKGNVQWWLKFIDK